jgi:subtilase family serine protease
MTDPAAYDPNASASSPATSPYVIAASGTTLRTVAGEPTWARENVWFGAGGSPSSLEAAPAYQAPLTYGQYAGQRGPDIAMDANPGTGAQFYYNGGLIQVGGTSLSAPLFTGAWARILQADGAGLGFAGPHLYTLTTAAFHAVTAGNNRGDAPVGGYIARPGWDWATGLGSLDVGVAASQLAN